MSLKDLLSAPRLSPWFRYLCWWFGPVAGRFTTLTRSHSAPSHVGAPPDPNTSTLKYNRQSITCSFLPLRWILPVLTGQRLTGPLPPKCVTFSIREGTMCQSKFNMFKCGLKMDKNTGGKGTRLLRQLRVVLRSLRPPRLHLKSIGRRGARNEER